MLSFTNSQDVTEPASAKARTKANPDVQIDSAKGGDFYTVSETLLQAYSKNKSAFEHGSALKLGNAK